MDAPGSSRTSDRGAGWACQRPGAYLDLVPRQAKRLSWFNLRLLWACRNDVLARWLFDPVARKRTSITGRSSDRDLTVDLSDRVKNLSLLLLGDAGEGDKS